MKKLISVLAIILVLFAVGASVFSVNAEDVPTAVASTEFLTRQGEVFTTTIYIPDNANIVDFDITLKYDTELVSLEGVEENEDIKGTVVYNDKEEGVIRLNYTRTSSNVTKYLPILDLTFHVEDSIGIGVYSCLDIDYTKTYIAHKLNSAGRLETVEFACDFAELVIYEVGDVDLSTAVDIGDATYIRRHLAELEGAVLTDFKLALADTYTDGIVDIADAVSLQRHLAELDVIYGDRVNVTFYDSYGNKYMTKSVYYGGTLVKVPKVPYEEGKVGGVWSQSASEYIAPDYKNLTSDISLYVYYNPANQTTEALEYYKEYLASKFYSGDLPTNMSTNLDLIDTIYYQKGYHASLVYATDCNYVLNQTTGEFTKPTYPQDVTMSIRIISYDETNAIEGQDTIEFLYKVPGMFVTPTKAEIQDWIYNYFTDEKDNTFRVNFDVKLISSITSEVIPVEGGRYDDYEVRLDWYQKVNGELVPVSQIKRTTSTQVNDYVAVASFNGKPLEGDGKIYVDNVEVTAIEQMEIKNYIINQIAANMGTLATDKTKLWNNDKVFGTNVTWETGKPDIAYVTNNEIALKKDAVSGSTLPLNARVSYEVDGGAEEFVLSYNLTVSCDNTIIKAPENMDPDLYAAIKAELEEELGYRGDLTSAALSSVKFVNLDLSGYPDIASLRGLSYCTNLRTLNISGLKILDGTMNQIATLSYLEAFIARGCELDNLSDGGTATLKNAVNLRVLDLTNNNFTSLDSVFAEGVKYGKLREVYLSDNKITNIDALSRAPLMDYLSLSNNGLTTEDTAAIANYPLLYYLSLANNNIDSVEHLKNLKCLGELRLQNNKITNVNDLRRLIHLQALYLSNNQIKDIGFLNTMSELKVLYVNKNQITDISALTELASLEAINISDNKISNLSVLSNYKGTLTEIYAENNQLTDFSFINGASKLHILMLAGNKMELPQSKMSSWLYGLAEMQVLTLSDIRLNDLSFLPAMNKLVRFEVANCGISAKSGDQSNIEWIADKYATLKILNISNNDMSGSEDELLKLRDASALTVLYADNVCDALDVTTLTYSMPGLKYISLENNGIDTLKWLFKYSDLAYVDVANNNITSVSFDSDISNASIKTLEELYLDTNVPCAFANAYRITDMSVKKLSLAGISVDKVEHLPYLDNIQYLNLSNTGLTNLTGADVELADLYSIARYETVETIDVSHLETSIAEVENLPNIKTVYAVGATDGKLFYEENLHTLQRMYNKGVTCYLYDKATEYEPQASVEGEKILNLLDDISCDVIVAADNVFSDNNPFMVDEINDFDITWTVSNSENYEIVDNYLSVKSYAGIEDEALTITAQITVYPDQPAVSREFIINTSILRASANYFETNNSGYSKQLTRDKTFTYDVKLKAYQTDGFAMPVKPVEDSISYSFVAVRENGEKIPYANVLTVQEGNVFTINSAAPLNATVTIAIDVLHNKKDGTEVADVETILVPVTVVSRTFTVNVVLNGGSLVDANGVNHETYERVEDSLVFEGLTVKKTGYIFEGWYYDAAFEQPCSATGDDVTMPSENISLYAKWKAHSFNLKFDANGGTVSETSRLVLCDTAIGTMPTPQRTGYTFDGWFTSDGKQLTADSKIATAVDITVIAKWTIITYKASWNTGDGYTITVNRTSSPNAKASTGALSNGSAIYYGDVLSVAYAKKDYYSITKQGVTSITVTGNVTSSSIYATAELNPISGWVLESQLPAGAQVVEEKWSYTKTTNTESKATSLSGYTQTGSYWVKSGSGSVNYASFPSGFDTSHSYYKNFNKSALSGSETATTKRIVENKWSGYVYWHWMYNVAYAKVTNRAISSKKGTYGGYYYGYFYAIASSVNCPALDKYYCNSQNLMGYDCRNILPASTGTTDGMGCARFFRFDYYTSYYTDYYKMFQYRKVENLESSSKITASSSGGVTVSNVQRLVRYRAK